MKKHSIFGCALALSSILLAGCQTKNGAARVHCGSLEMYQGQIGTLNSPQLKLGHVILLSADTKKAFQVTLVRPASSQIDLGATNQAFMESFKSQFTVDFDVTIPQTIQLRASNVLSKSSVLVVSNFSRIDIVKPLEFLNQSPDAVAQIRAAVSPSNHLIFVTAVIPASFVKLAATNAAQATVATDIVKIGNYNLHVSYICNDDLLRLAGERGSSAFFKYIPLRATTNGIVLGTFSGKLSDYDFSAALR